jgi:hypothetical protein
MRAVGLLAAVVVTASSCGGSGSDNAAERPWADQGLVREQVTCPPGEVSISFTPARVTVTRGHTLLGSATVNGRSLSTTCDEVEATRKIESRPDWEKPDAAIQTATKLTCRTGDVVLQVHPILHGDRPSGSVLLLLASNGRTPIFSAPLKPGGARFYHDKAVCSPA